MPGRSTSAAHPRPRTRRRAARAAALAAATMAVAVASGCGVTDIPATPRTVTVTVDAPTSGAGAASGGDATPTAVPTQTATPTAVPTALAVGKQRGAPHSFDEAAARVAGARPATGVTGAFASPTGNIRCLVAGGPAAPACELAAGRVPPPQPGLCPAGGAKDIGRIQLTDRGAVPVCNTDTTARPGAPTLEYGSRTSGSAPVQCVSEEFGVTCVDTAHRHGFFIARETFVTF